MIWIAFGQWSMAGGRWTIRERIYWHWKPWYSLFWFGWTPLVKMRWRRYRSEVIDISGIIGDGD